MICFAGDWFYANKGTKKKRFLGRVVPELYPWDNSFANYVLSETGGIRYNIQPGMVGTSACPFGTLFSEARDKVHRGRNYSAERVVIVTNRLAWGTVKTADLVIGSGVVRAAVLSFLD